jgi:hypothetical protein
MRTMKSGLLLLGLGLLICMFVPSTMLAQDETLPPCCHNNAVIVLPLDEGIIVIIDLDTTIPPEESQPAPEPAAQLLPTGSSSSSSEMAADRSRFVAVTREFYRSVPA